MNWTRTALMRPYLQLHTTTTHNTHTYTHARAMAIALPNNTNFTTRNANLSHNLNFEHFRILESTKLAIIISTILTETFRNHFVCSSIVHHSKCLMFVQNAKFHGINWFFFSRWISFSIHFMSTLTMVYTRMITMRKV